ncbi:MAG: hypothetical protein ACFCUU_09565 [Cyclobacteriaceae bacterium]
MQHIILKKDIPESKMEALINFLQSWDIEAELVTSKLVPAKKKSDFSLSAGLWKNKSIDATELRKQVWNRNL